MHLTLPPLLIPSRQLIVPTRCPRCGRWRTRRRYAPRDRLRHRLLNASSGVQVSTTGIVIASTGTVVTATTNGDTCCCTTAGSPCSRCSGTTPATWVLSFSSVTTSTTCFGIPTESSAKITTGGSPFSGTFTLTQNGLDPCLWEYSAAYSTYIATFYLNDACSGAGDQTTDSIHVSLFKFSSTQYTIKATLFKSGTAESSIAANLFNGTATGVAGCTSVLSSVTNNLTAYGFLGELAFNLGKDGTVDATPT